MFEHVLHGGTRDKAHGLRAGFDRRRLWEGAMVLIEILIPGLVGALFFAWLISSATHWRVHSSSDLAPGCANLGRGGNPCVVRPVQNDRADQDAKAEVDCLSFGRGGRLCVARPSSEAGTN